MQYQAKTSNKPRQFVALIIALSGAMLILFLGGALFPDDDAGISGALSALLIGLGLGWVVVVGLSQMAVVVWSVSPDSVTETIRPRFPRLPYGLYSTRHVAMEAISRWHVERAGFGSEQREVIVLHIAGQPPLRIHTHQRRPDPDFLELIGEIEERLGPMYSD